MTTRSAPRSAADGSPGRAAGGVVVCAALLAAGFLAVAATRSLQFDETLVLRAGWLLAAHVPAAPPFAMPATLAAGAASRGISDPGALFLVLRVATALVVLAALAWAARRACPTSSRAAGAVCLMLLSYAFVAHGVEFRYDAAILAGLLVAFGLVVRGGDADFAPLGAAAAFVGAHHLKGLVFAAAILAFGVLRARGERRRLGRLAAGAAAAAVLWIAIAAAFGCLGDAFETVATFGRLGAGAAHRWPWETPIARTFQLDAIFWVATAIAAFGAIRDALRTRSRAWLENPEVWAVLFLAATAGFPFVHPAPWPYMLVLPVPFAAILVARKLSEWLHGPRRVAVLGAAAAALAAQTFLLDAPIGTAWWASVAAPRAPEVEALRTLRRLARPGEAVFDPSGLAYFLPPCTREWYVDTLFEPGAKSGTWMSDAARLEPRACPWVLFTYRLGMLPDGTQKRLAAGWERRAWGLGLRRGDPRLGELPPPRRGDEITTFW